MKNAFDAEVRVPATLQLPETLAECLNKEGYDWAPLVDFFVGGAFSPQGVAETLQTLYFEFARMIPLMHEEITVEANELCEHLYTLERLYRAIKAMEEAEGRR